jgi:hypothetical protein
LLGETRIYYDSISFSFRLQSSLATNPWWIGAASNYRRQQLRSQLPGVSEVPEPGSCASSEYRKAFHLITFCLHTALSSWIVTVYVFVKYQYFEAWSDGGGIPGWLHRTWISFTNFFHSISLLY